MINVKNFWQTLNKPLLTTTPMAGITDSAWRQICKAWGADVVHTEFVSADAIYYGSKKTMQMIAYQAAEQPVVVQLFGQRPEMYGPAAKIVESTGVAGIDINFGCPAKKVAGHGGGICMLRDLDTVHQIVQNTIGAVKIPVSVKSRASLHNVQGQPEQGRTTALDLIEKLADLPLAAMIIHGRTYETPFTGPADLEMLKAAKAKFKSGVFLINGSFQTIESVVGDLKYTGADGVALSRALYGQPWLFKQIREYLETGKYTKITWPEIKETAIRHAHLLYEDKGPAGFLEMRKHLLFYVKGHERAVELRQELVSVTDPGAVEKVFTNL